MGIYLYRHEKQEGPYDLETLQLGLADGSFSPDDPAMSEDGTDWVRLHTLLGGDAPAETAPPIDPAVARLIDDEQDPRVMAGIMERARDMLTPGEEIDYAAVQKKPLVNFMPGAVLLTNKRLMIVKPRLMGMEFEEYPWNEVTRVHISEHLLNATVSCTITSKGNQWEVHVDSIPKIQARRMYARVQVHEEQSRGERKARGLDALRATTSAAANHSDPVAVLSQLKKMLDDGLIQPADYEAKKVEILARM